MSAQNTDWIDIGALAEIPLRGARVIKSAHGCIAVFRTSTGEAFAVDDKCPHKGGPLSQGIVHGRSVTCPLHNWVIALDNGLAQGADKGQVRTYSLKIEGDRVLIERRAILVETAA